MKQLPLFVENVKYGDYFETFYFHYGIDYSLYGVKDREPGFLYTGGYFNPVRNKYEANTISIDTIEKTLSSCSSSTPRVSDEVPKLETKVKERCQNKSCLSLRSLTTFN